MTAAKVTDEQVKAASAVLTKSWQSQAWVIGPPFDAVRKAIEAALRPSEAEAIPHAPGRPDVVPGPPEHPRIPPKPVA
jgi:hypothetical protein